MPAGTASQPWMVEPFSDGKVTGCQEWTGRYMASRKERAYIFTSRAIQSNQTRRMGGVLSSCKNSVILSEATHLWIGSHKTVRVDFESCIGFQIV